VLIFFFFIVEAVGVGSQIGDPRGEIRVPFELGCDRRGPEYARDPDDGSREVFELDSRIDLVVNGWEIGDTAWWH
jgi:hypothetical protein